MNECLNKMLISGVAIADKAESYGAFLNAATNSEISVPHLI